MTDGNTFDKDVVRKVAHLARLRVCDAELDLYAEQLARVLDHMSQLNELDTTNVAPTAHALPIVNVLRDDEPRDGLTTQDALHNAPRHRQEYDLIVGIGLVVGGYFDEVVVGHDQFNL